MNRNFKLYAIIWAILLVVFNVVVFLVRPVIPGYVITYDARFWIAWAFIIVAFIGNLICAFVAFRSENLRKVFYNVPLITISWTALIVMLVVGCVLMLIPNFPAWITAIICILVLAFNAIAAVKAAWAAGTVESIDDKIRSQTSYISNLRTDAESVLARAKSEQIRASCKKVFDAVKYSDPVSVPELSVIEARITVKMDELASAVIRDEEDTVRAIADELVVLIGDRNVKARMLKG